VVTPAFVITGAPAIIIILVILALIVLGIVSFFRMTARGAKRVVNRVERTDKPRRDPDA
jgi:uncharacterized membrane protein